MKPQQQKRKKVDATSAQPVKATSKMSSSAECMSNAVVLRIVLSNLNATDLINCRRVNKLWYSEVNSVMRRSNIALKISSECLLDQVGRLTNVIPTMNLPFNGLSFRKFARPQDNADSGIANPHDFLKVLPPIKHLGFDDSSAANELIVGIMESNLNHLEQLMFENSGDNLPPKILRAIFNLKKLTKINGTTDLREHPEMGKLCAIIKECESLQSVEGIVFQFFHRIPRSRWHVIKNFKLCRFFEPLDWRMLEEYLEVVPANQRFTSLMIKFWSSSQQERWMIMNLVKSCKRTLTSLSVDFGKLKFKYFYDLCREGSELRNLTITGHTKSRDEFESQLLGVFPEEVHLLRELNLPMAQLRKMQIVPVRPALHHLKGLKDLMIKAFQFRHVPQMFDWDNERARRRVPSKILKALSLERMGNVGLNF